MSNEYKFITKQVQTSWATEEMAKQAVKELCDCSYDGHSFTIIIVRNENKGFCPIVMLNEHQRDFQLDFLENGITAYRIS